MSSSGKHKQTNTEDEQRRKKKKVMKKRTDSCRSLFLFTLKVTAYDFQK